ncbi:MAG: pyrroline-5-carboxylate reductase [Thiotrichales bacterium]|nr:pyrroline-5-carboxylate reductase [Thiotrichales bacterium]
MSDSDIGFVGGGNMATSLIGGLVANGTPPGSIRVSDPDTARLDALVERFGVQAGADNAEVAARCATVVLAVKPQIMGTVVRELAPTLGEHAPLLVSIAAGVRETDINRWSGGDMAIVRTMPNTPALVGCGATALCANAKVDAGQRERADAILKAVGITIWVDDEAQLDAVTALSGSGPAYYFLLMEIMQATGEAMGLDAEAALRLTLQTALGAARIANESDEPPAVLRERVTSPGGTTERALVTMREGGIDKVVGDGIRGARQRSIELGDALGD